VKLNKLVIQNFLSIHEATLKLADRGLVSIEGDNQDDTGSDSNGAGKSSIINAILWCLYGAYGKDEGADDVVNSKVGKNCMVQAEWIDEGSKFVSGCHYRITRYRKHSSGKNSVRVEAKIPGLTIERIDGTIEKPEYRDITKAGAQAVQEQINHIMGADEMVFRASCFVQQENPVDIPAMTDKQLKELLETVLPIEDLTGLHRRATDNVNALTTETSVLTGSIWLKESNITQYKAELKEALNARFAFAGEIERRSIAIDEQIKLKRTARGVALVKANKGTLEADIEELRFRLDTVGYSDMIMASYKHNEAEKLVDALKWQLAHPVNTCGECGQEVEDLDKVTTRIQTKLHDAEVQRDRLRDEAKVASYNHAIKKGIESEIKELEQALLEANRSREAATRLEAEIRLLEGQKAPLATNPHQATVERLRAAIKTSIEDKETAEKDLKLAQEKLELAKAVQLTYSPKGLRYHILEKAAPRLTADTNKYLHALTEGAISAVWSTVTKTAAGDYREKFSIEAKMDNRTKFGLLSGGEKRKVRLACFFALQDLIASQATKDIELWCCDEIDVAVDPAGLERLMGVLDEKVKSKKTILVISHNELRDWIPNQALVTRKNGISTITGYLNG
jgi:DNA repair exonuclease SbcCD ATPase subunit